MRLNYTITFIIGKFGFLYERNLEPRKYSKEITHYNNTWSPMYQNLDRGICATITTYRIGRLRIDHEIFTPYGILIKNIQKYELEKMFREDEEKYKKEFDKQ